MARNKKSETISAAIVEKRLGELVEAKLISLGDPEHKAARGLPETVRTVFTNGPRFMAWAGLGAMVAPRYNAVYRVDIVPAAVPKGDAVLAAGGLSPPVYCAGSAFQNPAIAEVMIAIGRAIRRYLTLGGELPTVTPKTPKTPKVAKLGAVC